MTISDQETVDLGRLAVAVESFAPADGQLTVDVAPFDPSAIDVEIATAWQLDVAGQRVSVLVSPLTALADAGSPLVEHLGAQFGVSAQPGEPGAWPPPEGTSVVAVRNGDAVEAYLACSAAPAAPVPEPTPVQLGQEVSGGLVSLGMLRDVPLEVSAELGRTRLSVAEILQLTVGSIVELDRPVGSPVDVVVNGSLIGRGEVVVIDDEYGVRITEILARMEDSI